MIIRDAGTNDIPAILDLIRQLGETDDPGPDASAEHIASALAHPALQILVAEDGGRVAGFLACTVRPNLYHGADAGHVDELVVDRDCRGRGIGTMLLTEFLERMRRRGCAEVSVGVLLGNDRAQRLYRAMGFTEEVLLLERHLT
jgi:ribosomal protein S18 acetylase RimI-like enzyme